MLTFYTLITFVISQFTYVLPEEDIDGCRIMYISSQFNDTVILKEGLNKIHKMVLNTNDNILYFIFDKIARVPRRVVGYLDINTRTSGIVEGIRNATCIAVDHTRNEVYVGGPDGLFTVNNLKAPEKIIVPDHIQSMYFKNALFYIHKKSVYMYDRVHTRITPLVQNPLLENILAGDGNAFFTQGMNLLRFNMRTNKKYYPMLCTGKLCKKLTENRLFTDFYDNVYVSEPDGVYKVDKYKHQYIFAHRVLPISDVSALTFNKAGEPIYAVGGMIVHLKYKPIECKDGSIEI